MNVQNTGKNITLVKLVLLKLNDKNNFFLKNIKFYDFQLSRDFEIILCV